MKSEELNALLKGFSIVRRLEFSVEVESGAGTLIVELARRDTGNEEVLMVEFLDAASLSVRDFGGGLTQLLQLHVEDISYQQLDRRNYKVRDLERESFSFVCSDFKTDNG